MKKVAKSIEILKVIKWKFRRNGNEIYKVFRKVVELCEIPDKNARLANQYTLLRVLLQS